MATKFTPFTKKYSLSTYPGDAPAWMIEQRKEQKEQIYELRAERQRQARRHVAGFAGEHCKGAGPWLFDELYSAWREVASNRLADWNYGYKSRWLIGELARIGYRVSGRRVTVYLRNPKTGLKDRQYRRHEDRRIVERELSVI